MDHKQRQIHISEIVMYLNIKITLYVQGYEYYI